MKSRGTYLGNPEGIIRAAKKAEQGKNVVLAFLGGSITQGSLASMPTFCYAYLVYEWWKKTFPDASFTYINAGIGGTSSLFGAVRVQEDVLKYSPDFIILDFTVNDENTDFFMETYESLILRILSHPSSPGVMALCNAYYDDGRSAFECHKKILDHYLIPYVSVKETLYQDILDGKRDLNQITLDGLHPNDEGHRRIADLITQALEEIRKIVLNIAEKQDRVVLPPALTDCSYRKASRIQNNISPLYCYGFIPDSSKKNGVTDVFKGGWIGFRIGNRIGFEVKGSCLGIQYRRTVNKPAPVAAVYLDGDRDHKVILDGNFNEDWGDSLAITTLLHHGKPGKHVIEIEIINEVGEKDTPFYLVSLIQSGDEGMQCIPMDR
jgi:lysophospholipase L1-like esterase